MISFLRGTVVELLPMRLVIEVAFGVGYDVLIPLSTYDKLPQPGQTAKVLTHLQCTRRRACSFRLCHSRGTRLISPAG